MTTMTGFDWTGVAPSWDQKRDDVELMKAQVSDALLAQLSLSGGERVVELGAGTGEFAVRLADAVGPAGQVIASDAAAGMVDLLRDTLAGRGNVRVEQLDATATGLPGQSADVVVSRMVLMLVDTPADALVEAARLLTPGGRLGAAVWAGPEHNPWMTCVGMAAMMNGLVSGGPPTGPGGLFSLADRGTLERLLTTAGFADVVIREVPTEARFATTDEHFDTVMSLAGPLAAAYGAAPPEARARVRSTAAGLAEAHRTTEGLVLAGRALVCTAAMPQ